MNLRVGSLTSGLIYGSGLTLSGVASPRVIKDQFRLADFHMLLAFLSASASSAVTIAVYNSRHNNKLPQKKDSTYGWFGKYDGNVVGGALVGVGMALTGACPGTVLVQAAAGSGRSRLLTFSCLVAGITFVKLKQCLNQVPTAKDAKHTVMEATKWSRMSTVITYEALLLTIIALTATSGPRGHYILHPIVGGLLIGLGQISSVVLTKKPVGVSAAYEDVGKLFWGIVEGKAKPAVESIVFTAGLIAGARLTMTLVPTTVEYLAKAGDISLASALSGGLLLTFGSRIAGGCTSGHGISGMAAMGLSSFVTVASMFGSAIVTAGLMNLI